VRPTIAKKLREKLKASKERFVSSIVLHEVYQLSSEKSDEKPRN
jgi:hypothetical protein